MKRLLLSLPVLAALMGATLAVADDKPAEKAAPTPAALKTMLDDLGLKPQPQGAFFEVAYDRDNYRVTIRVAVSGKQVVLLCRAAYVPRPGELPAAALRKLLELNDSRSPDSWVYDEADRYVTYVRSFEATDLTPAKLKKQLDGFHAAVKAQEKDCKGEVFAPAMKPIVDDEYAKKQRAALKGKWKAVKGVYGGVETGADKFAKEEDRFHLDFEKGRSAWSKSEVAMEVRFEEGEDGGPARVSLYRGEDRTLYRGIYKLDGKKLILCLDYNGQTFPTEFSGSKESKGCWLLTLEKDEKE